MLGMQASWKTRFITISIITSVFCLFLLSYHLMLVRLGYVGLLGFKPVFSDEVSYFLQIKAALGNGPFSSNSGYFGYYYYGQEYVADWLNYGAHGWFLLVPHYLIGLFIGWGTFSPIVANSIILLAAFILCYLITKRAKGTVACMALSLTFLPLVLYFGTIMMEVPMYAISVVLAALLCIYVKEPTKKLETAYIVVVIISCLFRITNLVFFIPVILLKAKSKPKRFYLIYTLCACIISASAYFLNSLFSAQYPLGFLYQLMATARQDIVSATNMVFARFRIGAISFLDPVSQPGTFVFMRYFLIIMIVIFLVETFFEFDSEKIRYKRRQEINTTALSLVLILSSVILMVIALYDVNDWRDFRVFAPFLLFVCLMSLLNYRIFLIPAVISVSVSLVFLSHFGAVSTFTRDRYTNDIEQNEIIQQILYDVDAVDRWENTVTTTTNVLDCSFNAGIGIVYILSDITDNSEIKSKYVLLTHPVNLASHALIDSDGVYYLYERNNEYRE